MRLKRLLIISLIGIALFSFSLNSLEKEKLDKYDKEQEKKFQFSFGVSASSPDFRNIYQNHERHRAIRDGKYYSYPGMSNNQAESIQTLDTWMQKAILSSYTLRTMEYSIQNRILWNMLIAESVLTFLPTDYSDYRKTNLQLSYMVGLRYPHFIMPYFLIGPNFTLGFNPDLLYITKGNWYDKGKAFYDSIYLKPGLVFKTGVDAKFKRFSIGLYYQYKIKDFDEINYWKDQYVQGGLSKGEALRNLLGQQSRVGIAMNWYIFKDKPE